MVDERIVINTDERFTIDAKTRDITQTSGKSKLIQHDHNSECYEFEMDRYIDNHDMILCNKVQVNYINISSDRQSQSKGPYVVTDLAISPDDDSKIVFSWLISRNATVYDGTLNFNVTFKHLNGATVDYAWSTDIFKGIKVLNGIDNDSEECVEDYTDILEQWKLEVLEGFVRTVNGVAPDFTGNVELTASDVGALSTDTEIPEIDATLSIEGAAADAKAVGNTMATFNSGLNSKQPKGDYALKSEIPNVPETTDSDMYLVTDNEGNRVWAKQLAYVKKEEQQLVAETEITNSGSGLKVGVLSQLIPISGGEVAYVRFNDSVYETTVISLNSTAKKIDIPNVCLIQFTGVGKTVAYQNLTGQVGKISVTVMVDKYYTIDPNFIPTASETTKGGIIVGNGLVMNGDKINVKDEYALKSEIPEIPEIPEAPVQSVNGKVGDVQLTAADIGATNIKIDKEEPTDPDVNVWVKLDGEEDSVYAEHFTVGEGLQMSDDRVLSAKPENELELIETFIHPTTSSASSTVKNVEPSGVEYAFDAFIIKARIEVGDTLPTMIGFTVYGESSQSLAGALYPASNYFTVNTTYYIQLFAYKEHGLWRTFYTNPVETAQTKAQCTETISFDESSATSMSYAKTVNIRTIGAFSAVEVTVEGVRHRA